MIFATDLDRTIIFSSGFLEKCEEETICIEKYKENLVSHMTIKSINALENLKKKENLYIIPVTTRSTEQYLRVSTVQDCVYAITSNGGVILYKKEIFKPWKNHIDIILDKYKNEFPKILELMNSYSHFFKKEARIVDDMFLFAKLIYNEKDMKFFVSEISKKIDNSKWRFTLQGQKFYIIPREITKENALLFLKNYLNENKMVVSGDGKLDYGFLKIGDVAIIPDNSEVLNYIDRDFKYKSIPAGLSGTPELFRIVREELEKENKDA